MTCKNVKIGRKFWIFSRFSSFDSDIPVISRTYTPSRFLQWYLLQWVNSLESPNIRKNKQQSHYSVEQGNNFILHNVPERELFFHLYCSANESFNVESEAIVGGITEDNWYQCEFAYAVVSHPILSFQAIFHLYGTTPKKLIWNSTQRF